MSKDKETLVILTPGFPASETDDTCLPFHQSFVLSLKESYPQLTIIVLSFQYPYHKKRYSWNGITVIPFSGRNKGGLAKLLLRLKITRTLKKIHQTNKLKGLLSFWYNECAFAGKKFGDKYNIPHYCWLLGQDARKFNKYPRRLKLRQEELIALSDFIQEEFEKNHAIRPSTVIPPGISDKISPGPVSARDIDILGAGSLIALKQYDIFLRVVAEIKKQIPALRVVLIGDGPQKSNLEKKVKEMGLHSHISFTGEIPHPQVLQWMQRSKIFLHPSSYEGFSGVCLEALQAGNQVISFCRAMNHPVPQWHIVKDEDNMVQKAITILQTESNFNPVTPFRIEDTARRVMQLFSHEKK